MEGKREVLAQNDNDSTEPWSSSKYTRQQCVHDFISYLRCYAMRKNKQECENVLLALVNTDRFEVLFIIQDSTRDLFELASNVLLNNGYPNRTLTGAEVEDLYNTVIPSGVKLPFCVQKDGANYAWFVPVDNESQNWQSCLSVDQSLSAEVRMTQAMYSTSRVPSINYGVSQGQLCISPDPYEAVDMLVWLVIEILKQGRWHQQEDGRILRKADYDFVLESLRQITDNAASTYGAARRMAAFPL